MKFALIITAFVTFTIGLASGWWLAVHKMAPVAETLAAVAPAVSTTPRAPPLDNPAEVLWLTVEFDGGSSLVPAVILQNRGIMIASLYSLYPANRVYWVNHNTGETVFPTVIAADHLTQLIGLSYNGPKHDGLELSTETGTLHVGKEVGLQLPNEKIMLSVRSPLHRDDDGKEYYPLELSNQKVPFGGPLTDIVSGQLLGYVVQSRQLFDNRKNHAATAVDAIHIRKLLDEFRFSHALEISAFNDVWSNTTQGLRLSAQALYRAQRWPQAYAQSERLWEQANDYLDDDRMLLTDSAYFTAHQLIDGKQWKEALDLAVTMKQRFPGEQPWCLVQARAFELQKNWQAALQQVQICLHQTTWRTRISTNRYNLKSIETVDSLRHRLRDLALTLYDDPQSSWQEKYTALLQTLQMAPNATLYRLLGDLEYDVQNYAQANNYYRSAISLDASLAAQLGNRLQNSQQRAGSAPLAEISYEQRRGAIIVSARLNDSPQQFRFLLDTGATYSAVSNATLIRLGMHDVFTQGAPVVELESAAGTIYAQLIKLASVELGAARVEWVPVVILENLEGVDGLLGLSFLEHFDVNLDQQAGKLILTRR